MQLAEDMTYEVLVSEEFTIALFVAAILLAVEWDIFRYKEKVSLIPLDEASNIIALTGDGLFFVTLVSQANCLLADYHISGAQNARERAIAAFRDDGFKTVVISQNTSDELVLTHIIHSSLKPKEEQKVAYVTVSLWS